MKKIINKFGIGTMSMLVLALVCSIAIFSGGSQTAFASSDLQVSEAGLILDELFARTISKYRTSATQENEGFGGWIYDEQFAGVWYDDNYNLNIGLATDNESRIDTRKSDGVIYHERKFSYNDLIEIHRELEKLMPKFTIFSVGMMPQHNQVEVILEDENQIKNIIQHLSQLSLNSDEAIRFVIDKMPTPINTPIHGGGGITSSAGGGTISAKAICNVTGRVGIVTNAHVAEAGATRNFRERVSNNIIAAEREQWLMSGIADTAFVPFANQNNWFMDSSASWLNNPTDDYWSNDATDFTLAPSTYQVAGRGEIIVGPVVKFGQTSGRTEGQITAVSVSVNVGYASGTATLTDQLRTNVRALPGDSGSPLFYINGGRLRLVGTIFSSTFHTGGSTSHASMITNVITALNVTIMSDNIYTTSTSGLSSGQISITGTTRNLVGNVRLPDNFNDGTTTRTVTAIGNSAFINQTQMSQVSIPDSVTSIGTSIFEGCTSLKSISVDVSNANYASISGILYDKSFTSFVCIPAALSGIIDIPGSVATIPERAFAEKYWLTEVNISSGSTTIGKEAFLSCSSLSSVTIINNSGTIGERSFSSCYSLSSVQLGNDITSIGNEAFAYGNIFTSITLPNSVTAIGYGAFKQCNNMTTLTLPFVGSGGSINYFGYIFGAPALSGQDCYLPYNLTTVTITGGNIAESALLNCSSITTLNVSSNVNFIGFGAFQGCSGLLDITLPFVGNVINNFENTFFGYVFGATSFINNLAYVPANLIYVTILGGIVDDLSFANCQNITNIWLSNSVLSIGYRAFNNCINLTGISIGNAVTAIDSQAFFICTSLTQISVSSNNQNYSSQAGVLFNKNKTILNTFPNGKGGSYVIPNSVTCIGSKAFYNCFELNSVTFPNGLTTIADRAFYGCASIININIPTQVATIGDEAFYGCTGLQNIALSNGINSIGNRAFVHCNSLSNLIIPNSIVSMGSYLFTNCSNLSIIYNKYPEESLLPNGWSSNWNDINVSVSYYSTTPKNGYWRFLEEIPTVWQVYDNLAFTPINGSTEYSVMNASTSITDIVLPTTYNNLPVTKIETNGFDNSTSLVSIHIPLEITTIGSNAFYGCSNLTIYVETISKPSGWENSWNSTNCPVYWGIKEQNNLLYAISDGFAMVVKYKPANTSSMVSIVIPSNILVLGNSYIVNNIESNAFNGFSNISNVTIPNVLTNIGEYAFENCSNLNEITILDNVIAIGNYAFYGCSSIIIYAEPLVKPNNWSADWNGSNRQVYWGFIEINCAKYSIENGTATLIKYSGNASIFAMPSTIIKNSASYVVTKIGAGAFSHNSTLATITISNTITTIEEMSFMGCSNLNSINIPSNVTVLGEYVFYYCNSLTSVTLSANINEIPAFSFAGCHNLVSIGIASSVKIIGESAFKYCNALLSINLPSAVTSIRSNSFESCIGLTTFILPNSLISIGILAFSGCSNISEIIIPSSVTSIGSYAFDSCGTIQIFAKVLYQPVGWSNNWNNSGCPVYWGMTELNGAQYFVRSISVELFRYAGSASSFTIPSSISIQGSSYTVEFIGVEAFKNRTTLTSITIPQTITQVGNNAFQNCNLNLQITWYYNTALTAQNFKSYLRYAHFTAGTTTILSGAFANCTKLTALSIPASVTSIISGAFQGCSNLILFWDYNPSMTAANFSAYLNYVNIPNNTTSISNNAFDGCNKLISIEIPSTVTSIGSYAFYGCSTLTKITIPSSVQNIGSSAFQNCTSLTIITNVTSKPSGWNTLWNDSNLPVYWLRTSSSIDIMSGFGYTGSTYYWTGIVNMSQSGTNYSYIRNDGAYVFTNNRIVTFAVRTGTKKNAISIINGSVVFALKNSNGTTIQSHQCSVSVSRTGAVTITSASFDINTSNLINGTYTLTMTSSFTRASWSGTSNSTITIVIDK